jgi:hypothetical protein
VKRAFVRRVAFAAVAIASTSCAGLPAASARVHCANGVARCDAAPGATITFNVPAQHCAPGERVCYFLASVPEEQRRQPAPTDHDKVSLQRTTIRGNHDEERVTVVTSRDDPASQRYYVEVRYAPMSSASQDPTFRVVLPYNLVAPKTDGSVASSQ